MAQPALPHAASAAARWDSTPAACSQWGQVLVGFALGFQGVARGLHEKPSAVMESGKVCGGSGDDGGDGRCVRRDWGVRGALQ